MEIDLFKADLDNITFSDIELFTGIHPSGSSRPENERPPEGIRLDYKVDMPDDIGKTVAAFANTYGGIIMLGIEEAEYPPRSKKQKQNIPKAIPGITTKGGDIKSRITNKIVATVYPRPYFSISRPVEIPDLTDKAVVVIRVEESWTTPHMFIKDNKNEIKIRVNDNNFPASLHEIEWLFERRTSRRRQLSENISDHFFDELFITSTIDTSTTSRMNQHNRIHFIPFDRLSFRLDRNSERLFEKQIKKSFNLSSLNIYSRHAEYYEIGICDYSQGKFINEKWRLYSNGSMGFISEFGGGSPRIERLGRLICDTICAFKVYKEVLVEGGYFGQSYLQHELSSAKETKLLPEMLEPVSNMYDPMEGINLGKDAISSAIYPHEHKISRTLDFSDIEKPEEIIAEIFLEHLRALFDGNIDYNKLLEHVRYLNF